jgi:tryptophan halogenase
MTVSVVIVGGGSAGWMTAAYLRKALGEGVKISLIESPRIPTIGVGEATFSTVKLFFDFLGLQEHEWMPSCNATYKLAIKFENWTREGGYFYHPFQRYESVDGFNLGEWWLRLLRSEEAFDRACFTVTALCDNNRSPRHFDGRVYDEKLQNYFSNEHIIKRNVLLDHVVQFPYGYHFDAGLLAQFLKNFAKQHGVHEISDDVVNVVRREDGGISHLELAECGEVRADLFIDCTGFRALLIGKTLEEPFISFQDSLLCDSAVALQVPADIHTQGIEPYTTATAMSAGWVWKTPLYGRNGTGYVYSSQFISKEDAEKELRKYLGPISDNRNANHIKMRIGRSRNSWVKNCVAVGLSSGFVEPLESTGIFFIQHSIEELVRHFPNREINEGMIGSYNQSVANCIDGVRDFLILHYRAGNRDDTEFWRANKNTLVPEKLAGQLDLWKTTLPNVRNINTAYHGFESYSYSVMLLGLGYIPESNLPVLDHMPTQNARREFDALKTKANQLIKDLPSHYEYLSHVRAHGASGA